MRLRKDNSSRKTKEKEIEDLINSFANHQPLFSSLGTPFLMDTDATQSLVGMGATVIPELVEALNAENPKIAMYAAYCLGQIGNRSALSALRQVKERYLTREPKREDDFGVISAINLAEERCDD